MVSTFSPVQNTFRFINERKMEFKITIFPLKGMLILDCFSRRNFIWHGGGQSHNVCGGFCGKKMRFWAEATDYIGN